MIKPYYHDDFATIYHGDCREIVPMLGRVDLTLTDPPYGIRVAKNGTIGTSAKPGNKRTGSLTPCTKFKPVTWDNAPPEKWIIDMIVYLSRQTIIWGGGHIGGMPKTKCWLVWDKKNDGTCFSDCEVAWTNLPRALRMYRHRWNGFLQEDMKNKEKRVHPCQKPVALMQWCIGLATRPRLISDPWMGSGSTLVAAKMLGIKSVGIERDESYCEIAAKRLREVGVQNV